MKYNNDFFSTFLVAVIFYINVSDIKGPILYKVRCTCVFEL